MDELSYELFGTAAIIGASYVIGNCVAFGQVRKAIEEFGANTTSWALDRTEMPWMFRPGVRLAREFYRV